MTRYRVKVSGWAIVEEHDRRLAENLVGDWLAQLGEECESVEFFTEAREATPAR